MRKIRPEAKEVVLLEKWMGQPEGAKLNISLRKADDLIDRGVAKPVAKKGRAKPTEEKSMQAPKNRQIKTG